MIISEDSAHSALDRSVLYIIGTTFLLVICTTFLFNTMPGPKWFDKLPSDNYNAAVEARLIEAHAKLHQTNPELYEALILRDVTEDIGPTVSEWVWYQGPTACIVCHRNGF